MYSKTAIRVCFLVERPSSSPSSRFKVLKKSLCIFGYPKHPLAHGFADNRKAADFAFPVHNFFVGEDGAELFAPPNGLFADIGKSLRITVGMATGFHFRRTGVAPVSIQEEAGKSETGATPVLRLDDLKFKPDSILELVNLVEAKTISSSAAQQVFAGMFETGKSPSAIVREKGLAQVSDTGSIEKFCDEAIAANPGPVADFKAGKTAALNFLKGQVMKLSKGKANPAVVGEILERKLKG